MRKMRTIALVVLLLAASCGPPPVSFAPADGGSACGECVSAECAPACKRGEEGSTRCLDCLGAAAVGRCRSKCPTDGGSD